MDKNKKIAFIDIEANQFNKNNGSKTEHFILEYSVFSDTQKAPLIHRECHCDYPLNDRLCQLLSKRRNYYKNIKISEKQVYLELLEIAKEYNLICFGNYDQIILNSAAQRYNLDQIKLIDYALEVNQKFETPKQLNVSLYQLKSVLKLQFKNEKEHNSFWDAKILKYIYLKIQCINKIEKYKKYLMIERIRPKRHESSRYKNNIFVKVKNDYKIFLMQSKVTKYYESTRQDVELTINVYDQNFNLVKNYYKFIENYNTQSGTLEFNNFKNNIINQNKNFYENLFIFDGKLWTKFFKENKNTCYAPYKITDRLFSSMNFDNKQKLKLIKNFYLDGEFEKDIDYNQILKQFKIK